MKMEIKLNKEKIAKYISPASDSILLNVLSYINLLSKKINASFPVFAPPSM